jgi:hypothetical protein
MKKRKMNDLVERDGLYYLKFDDVPFTGRIYGPRQEGVFKDGKKDGLWVKYHDKGIYLESRGVYRDGKKRGLWSYYHPNGNPRWDVP